MNLSAGSVRVIAAILALALPSAARAFAAPEPRKPFDVGHMAGRWYEIARTPNHINQGCQGSTTDWAADGPGKFRISAVCHKGAPDGPEKVIHAEVRITDPVTHAKVRMALLGGLISSEYWLLDHADDYRWLIMGTPNGRFISIMASRPHLPADARAEALNTARRMGYDISGLVFPVQSPAP